MTLAALVYGRMTRVYHAVFTALLQEGRRRALLRLRPAAGEAVLEVGVGTGADLREYQAPCHVVAVDLSMAMLKHARGQVAGVDSPRVAFACMDGMQLAFPDDSFDAVYAPHVVNVVAEPVAFGRELARVCRPGGRVVLLNHFHGVPDTTNLTNQIVGRIAGLFSVNWGLQLDEFLAQAGLEAVTIESVNYPRLSSIVVCRKSAAA